MKKYRIRFEIFKQKVWVTVEGVSRMAAQAEAYRKIKQCKKEITEIVEL